VPLDAPLPIARWLSGVLRGGRIPYLRTQVSPAVRLCQAALAQGVELRGTQLLVGAEPLTPARLAAIRQVGAEALPRYAWSVAAWATAAWRPKPRTTCTSWTICTR
jgi:hypothetical protein